MKLKPTTRIRSRWWTKGLGILLVVVAIALLSAVGGFISGRLTAPPEFTTPYERALVRRVIDGDTIELEDGRTVRYIGIDAPETHHPEKGQECYGAEATERNRELAEGKFVELLPGVEDKDSYGRFLRYVYADGVFVNAQLIVDGCAVASSFGPERWFRQVFTQLQQYSKLKHNGMWDMCR